MQIANIWPARIRRSLKYPVGFVPTYDLASTIPGFTTTHHGQVISNLDILCDDNPVIIQHRVHMRNCRIRYLNGSAIQIGEAGARSVLEELDIAHIAKPTSVVALPSDQYAIRADTVHDLQIKRVQVVGGATALEAVDCEELDVRQFAVKDIFGSQAIRLNGCASPHLHGFSVENALADSYTDDLLLLTDCDGAHITHGFLRGNNSPSAAMIKVVNTYAATFEHFEISNFGAVGALCDNSSEVMFKRFNFIDRFTTGQGGRAAPSAFVLFKALDNGTTQLSRNNMYSRIEHNIDGLVDANLLDDDYAAVVDIRRTEFSLKGTW